MATTKPKPGQSIETKCPPGFVRVRLPEDVPAIRALMARAYPHPHGPEAVWSEATLLTHLRVFPEGQLIAVTPDGSIVGSASSLRIASNIAVEPHTWSEITGYGQLTTHDPAGDALYGVNIVVDPGYQSKGYARLLYDARIRLARQLGCKRIVAGARIPGFHKVVERMTLEDYVNAVTRGEIFDATLSKQLKIGFRVMGALHNYAPDPETLGHAALIVLEVEPDHAL
ncbi:MAG: GNAT family N-acetyltransferase [Holophagaceae bacterium]|nr:GNAT family N-acetyltransferase [Holophagaceae bacterium]